MYEKLSIFRYPGIQQTKRAAVILTDLKQAVLNSKIVRNIASVFSPMEIIHASGKYFYEAKELVFARKKTSGISQMILKQYKRLEYQF